MRAMDRPRRGIPFRGGGTSAVGQWMAEGRAGWPRTDRQQSKTALHRVAPSSCAPLLPTTGPPLLYRGSRLASEEV